MPTAITSRRAAAAALFASAAAWPSLHCLALEQMRSPLERAMAAAFCGDGSFASVSHGPACLAGAAALLLAGAFVLGAPDISRAPVGAARVARPFGLRDYP